MSNLLKKFSSFYFDINKKMNKKFDEIVHKDLEVEKRKFVLANKVEPVDFEVKEMRKRIVARKGIFLLYFCFVILIFFYLIT